MKKIDKYTLSQVQHKTGSQRLNIQSLADTIIHLSDNPEVVEKAKKIVSEMERLTDNLQSVKYIQPRFFEIEGYWKEDKTPIDGYIVCVGDAENVQVDQEIFHYFDSMEELKEAMKAGSTEEFIITDYSEQ